MNVRAAAAAAGVTAEHRKAAVLIIQLDPAQKLELAAELISQVVDVLDKRESLCPCCNRVTYANWTAKMARDSLSELPKRLRRIAFSDTALAPDDGQPFVASKAEAPA